MLPPGFLRMNLNFRASPLGSVALAVQVTTVPTFCGLAGNGVKVGLIGGGL